MSQPHCLCFFKWIPCIFLQCDKVMKRECFDSVRKWMISLLSAFLPVHPFGFKLNNYPTSVAQMCENNGQGEWNFLLLKIPQRKANRESNGRRCNTGGHPAWYSCITFSSPKTEVARECKEDILMNEWEAWKFPLRRWEDFISSHLGLQFDLTLSDFQQCGLFDFQSYLLIVELKYNLL